MTVAGKRIMPDESLDVLVKLTADTSGAKQAVGALGDVKKEAGAAGKAEGQAHDEAGEAAEKHHRHLHRLHKIFHALNEVVPGLGIAAQAAFTPAGAAISVVVMGLKLLHEKMKEINEEFERLEEEAARPATHRMEALRDRVVEVAKGMAELHAKLEEAAKGEQKLSDIIHQTDEEMKEQAQEAASLYEALEKNELASLERSHAAGLVSEAEYAKAKLEIEQEFRQKKRQIEENAEMLEILARRRQLENAIDRQPELTAAAEEAEKKKADAQANLNSMRKGSEVEEDKKKAEAALKAFEKGLNPDLLSQFESFGTGKRKEDFWQWAVTGPGSRQTYHEGGSEQYVKWDELKRTAKSAIDEFSQFPRVFAQKQVAADQATREAERAARRAEEKQGFITDTQREVERRRSALDTKHQNNAAVEGLENDTAKRMADAAALKSKYGKEVVAAAEEHEAEAHGRRLDTKHQASLKAVTQMLQQQHQNADAIFQGIEASLQFSRTSAAAHQKQAHALAQLTSQVEALQVQIRQTRNP
jgi:hypothetical protein